MKHYINNGVDLANTSASTVWGRLSSGVAGWVSAVATTVANTVMSRNVDGDSSVRYLDAEKVQRGSLGKVEFDASGDTTLSSFGASQTVTVSGFNANLTASTGGGALARIGGESIENTVGGPGYVSVHDYSSGHRFRYGNASFSVWATAVYGPTSSLTADSMYTITSPTVVVAAATECQIDTPLFDVNATTCTMDGTTFTATYPTATVTANTKLQLDSSTEVESNTALLDLNATTWTADGTTATITYPTCTITANTKLQFDSSTEVEVNAGVLDLNATTCTIDATGTHSVTSGGDMAFAQTRPTTDIPAPSIRIKPARATSFATAVTANKVGGGIIFEAGEPRTAGTDQPGPIPFYLGKIVGGNLDNGAVFYAGTEASVDYKLGHIRCQGDIWAFDAYRPFRITTQNAGHGITLQCDGTLDATSEGAGIFRGKSNTTLGYGPAGITYVTAPTVIVECSSVNRQRFTTAVTEIRVASNESFDLLDVAGVARARSLLPADTPTTDDTLTTLASFTPTARPSTYEVTVHAFTSGGADVASWTETVTAVQRSGAAALIGAPVTSVSPDRNDVSLATAILTIDTSTTTIRIRGAGVAATNLTWTVTVTEKK